MYSVKKKMKRNKDFKMFWTNNRTNNKYSLYKYEMFVKIKDMDKDCDID